MEMEALISVIVPVFNVEKYLSECIESILNQSYYNLEILLVDDGSSDKSGEICDYYAELDSRVKVIHQENKGVSAARNTGLARATGDYIGFVDGDDYIKPDMYFHALKLACKYECEVVFFGYSRVFDSDVTEFISLPELNFNKKGRVDVEEAMFLCHGSYFTSVWNKLYLKKACDLPEKKSYIKFDTNINLGEDVIWLYKVLSRCQNIYVDKHELYVYRQRNGSLTHGLNLKRLIENEVADEYMNEIAKTVGKDIDCMTAAIAYICCYKVMVEAYRNDNYLLVEKYMKRSKVYQKRQMKSSYYSLAGKIKRQINIKLMKWHFPFWIINRIDRMKR